MEHQTGKEFREKLSALMAEKIMALPAKDQHSMLLLILDNCTTGDLCTLEKQLKKLTAEIEPKLSE